MYVLRILSRYWLAHLAQIVLWPNLAQLVFWRRYAAKAYAWRICAAFILKYKEKVWSSLASQKLVELRDWLCQCL